MPKRRITQAQADALEHGGVVALTQEQFEHLKQFTPATAIPVGFQPGGAYVLEGEPISYILTWMHRIDLTAEIHIDTEAIWTDERYKPAQTSDIWSENRTSVSYPELLMFMADLENGITDQVKDVSIEVRGSMLSGFTVTERKHPR